MIEELTDYVVTPKRDYKDLGITFAVRPGSSDQKAVDDVFDKNSYRRPRLGFTIDPGDRWIDGGANIGAFTVLASTVCGAEVLAFEADATNMGLCAYNIAVNRSGVAVGHAAIVHDSYEGEHVTLYHSEDPKHYWRQSIVIERKGSTPVQVPVVRIGQLVDQGWDCLKLDIEGAEIPILQTLDYSKVRKLTAEWSFDVDPLVDTLHDVVDTLRAEFPNVIVSAKEEKYPRGTVWNFFPPNAYLFAWR